MNNYFINITKNHNLKPLGKNKVDIYMFENYISIKNAWNLPEYCSREFYFKEVSKKKRNTQPKV